MGVTTPGRSARETAAPDTSSLTDTFAPFMRNFQVMGKRVCEVGGASGQKPFEDQQNDDADVVCFDLDTSERQGFVQDRGKGQK